MKVTEIISEQRTDEFLGAAGRLLWQAGKAVFGKANPTKIPGVPDVARKTQAMRDAIQAVKAAGLDPNGIWGKLLKNKVYREGLRNIAAYKAAGQRAAMDIFGDAGLKIVNTLFIVDSLYDYYTARALLGDRWKRGEISEEEYQKELTMLRGTFLAAYLTPKIAGGLARFTAGNAASLLGFVIKTAGFPKQGIMLKAYTDLTIKMGQGAALAFFSTDAGREWLTNALTKMIDSDIIVSGLGSFGDLGAKFLDIIKASYQVSTGNLPPGYEKEVDVDQDGKIQRKNDPWKGTGREVGIL